MVSEKMYELGSKKSTIRELFEYGKKQAAIVGKENVYDFSIGNPTVPSPACVKESIMEILETIDSSVIHGYTSAQGDVETRAAIAEYLNRTYDINVKADNFYMTCGAAASLCITLKALTESKENEFVVIAPYFPEYRVFIEAQGATFKMVPADTKAFQIDLEALEKAINANTKGMIINSPNNPSGVVYSKETIQKLAELLERKSAEYGHPIILISDEPYREIAYDDVEVPYVTKYYKNTIVCYSYSKSLSLPGERIGYILVPDEVENSKAVYAAVCGAGRALGYVCAPSLFQKVIARCTGQTGDVDLYKKNRDLLYENLTEMGYECVKPQGAFYLFVKALEEDSRAFAERAKEQNLLLVAADDFGCPGYVRVSYCVEEAMIKRSFAAFEKLAASYKE
ncbi:MAG: pyridoxal phosphate-dependent aminotransferase [Cellulosilyticum sp.]|nr:pyridoxal phosphate-dependent aminotransferase [Cellulosilyticum sp.]